MTAIQSDADEVGALRRVVRYVFYERNPIVQCLYVAVMCSSYYLFVTEAHPRIPNVYVDAYHKWAAGALFIVCFGLYVFMCRTDPGVITSANISACTKYPTHPVLFPEGKYCRTCKTLKIPRSKHCSMCNHCVARFDHHCIWFNGCVGANNYRHFLLFLVVQLALCVYVFYLSSSVFLVMSEPLLAKRKLATDATEQNERVEMAAALQHIIATNQSLGFVAAITLMIGLVVWAFLLMQLRRIALNTTANESFKRDDLYDAAELDGETTGRRMLSMLLQQLRRKVRNASATPRSVRKKALDASWGGTFSPDVILNTEESFSASDVRFNPYDLGSFWRNVQDALQLRASGSASGHSGDAHSHSHSASCACGTSAAASKKSKKTKQS